LLTEELGVHGTAEQLDLPSSQLYRWPSKAELLKSRGEIGAKLKAADARLKRVLAEQEQEPTFLGKAAAYFAKSQKSSTPRCRAGLASPRCR
jgi:transposase